MRVKLFSIVIVLAVAAMLTTSVSATEEDYYSAAAAYYKTTTDVIDYLVSTDMPIDEIPVILHIADRADVSPEKIAEQRGEGESWMEIVRNHDLDARVFKYMVVGDLNSEKYTPPFERFKTTPRRDWNQIEFTDKEIVNLVNLKFIYSHNDYSVYEVIAMRDSGKDFVTINDKVRITKYEMTKAEEAKRWELAKAEKNK
ncbi:MAG: hypothetical protein V3W18_13135 [candidate division Zixibacteria bacterium]